MQGKNQEYQKYLMVYPVRNNAPLLCSGDEDYSFSSEHGVQDPV